MISRYLKALILLLVLSFLTSCGSYVSRNGYKEYNTDFYSGVIFDFKASSYFLTECPNEPFLFCMAVGTIPLIDLPLSLVTDTIFIPYDLINYEKKPELQAGGEQGQ